MVLKQQRYSDTLSSLKKYVQCRNGMLVFNDEEAFKHVVNFLFNAVKVASTYNLDLGYLDEYDYVLEQFETMVGHSSLRRHVAQTRRKLLSINRLTADNDPEDWYFSDKIIQSIVTTNLEVYLGNKLISLRQAQNEYLKQISVNTARQKQITNKQINPRLSANGVYYTKNNKHSGRISNSGGNPAGVIQGGITITDFFGNPNAGNPLTYYFETYVTVGSGCAGIEYTLTVYDSDNNIVQPSPLNNGVGSFNFIFPQPGHYKVVIEVTSTNPSCVGDSATILDLNVDDAPDPQGPNGSPCCKAFQVNSTDIHYASNAFVRTKILLFCPFVLPYTSISARTTNYQKFILNYYQHKADYLDVIGAGVCYEGWCHGRKVNFNIPYARKWNAKTVFLQWLGLGPHFAKFQEGSSLHNFQNGNYIMNTDTRYITIPPC